MTTKWWFSSHPLSRTPWKTPSAAPLPSFCRSRHTLRYCSRARKKQSCCCGCSSGSDFLFSC